MRICDECGCGHDEKHVKGTDKPREIVIEKSVTDENDRIAHSTWHRLTDKGVFCINLMGAPGSGKTTLIEGMATFIGKTKLAVIQGDLESDIDKKRMERLGIVAFQINTHSGCHLTAAMVEDAIGKMKLPADGFLIIENVGNLVCPAGVGLGQHMNIVVSSTAEGADKPEKYPIIFHGASAAVISKYDIADAVGFDEDRYVRDARKANKALEFFRTSSSDRDSYKDLAVFLEHEKKHMQARAHNH